MPLVNTLSASDTFNRMVLTLVKPTDVRAYTTGVVGFVSSCYGHVCHALQTKTFPDSARVVAIGSENDDNVVHAIIVADNDGSIEILVDARGHQSQLDEEAGTYTIPMPDGIEAEIMHVKGSISLNELGEKYFVMRNNMLALARESANEGQHNRNGVA